MLWQLRPVWTQIAGTKIWRIDFFFKKRDCPKKQQHDDKEVKEDEPQPSNSKQKNPLSVSSSYLATVAIHPQVDTSNS